MDQNLRRPRVDANTIGTTYGATVGNLGEFYG
jgi:hypothetical protein